MLKRAITLGTFLLLAIVASAQTVTQQDTPQERRMIRPSIPFFVPHWYVKAQGGMAYDVGEAKFSQLLSPSLQIAVGHKFNEYFGLRGSFSGMWAKNRYSYPEKEYEWNFIQPALDAEFDLTNILFGYDPEYIANAYAFVGIGAAYSFNNDDVKNARNEFLKNYKFYNNPLVQMQPNYFEKAWGTSRWNPVVRFGLGADLQITEQIAIGAEVNANMLPDHFNSKKGKHDNKDWHFNALVGIKFNLGKTHGKLDPIYEEPIPVPQATRGAEFVDVPIEKISFNVNIYFLINQSIIRNNQIAKLTSLLQYLNEHPRAFIRLSGFADKETGTPEINMRLSIERSKVVSQYLQDKGIEEWRIRRFAKGDKVQPFDIPEDNRVCICYVYDPDNPVPQEFTY
jgi:outer membrane protein OmpA-like peptidoglycan-associated protein